MAKAVKGKKKTLKSQLPKPVPLGTVLKDVTKKSWCIGPSIGKGGFGEVYAACEGEKNISNKQKYAVKIEPKENGPLFVEEAFFIRVCSPTKLEAWKQDRKLTFLGVPALRGFGHHELGGDDMRFIVMDKMGKDFWSHFINNGKKLELTEVCKVAIQMVDALEYIHESGYTHGDIKGTNMLFETDKSKNVYLVDFGLVELISTQKIFKVDPRRQDNGTIEYISCDMHQGVPTRRSDMEILGFNILHWLTSFLPWEGTSDPHTVFEMKQKFLSSLKANKLKDVPDVVKEYLLIVTNMGHLDIPDYECLRNLLKTYSGGKSPLKRSRGTNAGSKKRAKTDREEKIQDSDNVTETVPQSTVALNKKKATSKLAVVESNKLANEGGEKISWKDTPAVKASGIFKSASLESLATKKLAGRAKICKKTNDLGNDVQQPVSPKGKDIIPGASKKNVNDLYLNKKSESSALKDSGQSSGSTPTENRSGSKAGLRGKGSALPKRAVKLVGSDGATSDSASTSKRRLEEKENKLSVEVDENESEEWISPKGKDIIPGAPKRKIKVTKSS